jgi:EthD domain-containing protein
VFKTIALLRRKSGMSRADFIDYYENHHSVLIRKLQPKIREYRRNYIDFGNGFISTVERELDFDVITEIWYDDRAAYEESMEIWNDPALSELRINDEMRFLDMSKIHFFIVDEHTSS